MKKKQTSDIELTIREYLYVNDMTVVEFSELIGCKSSYIYAINNEKRRPSRKLAEKIEKVTNGMIKSQTLRKRGDLSLYGRRLQEVLEKKMLENDKILSELIGLAKQEKEI